MVDSLKTSLKRSRFTQKDDSSSVVTSSAMENKLKELKEERAELYRQQGTQATHLLTLNDQLRSKDILITSLNAEIAALKHSQEEKHVEVNKLQEKVREGEEGYKILGDELVALQLELLRLDQWQNKRACEDDEKGTETNVNESSPYLARNESNPTFDCFNEKKLLKILKEKEIISPHQYPISSFTSKTDTRQLLTGSEDQKIILYDLTRISTKMVLKWSKMNGPIVSLALDEEGNIAASCSAYDKEVTIWTLSSGKIQGTLQFTDESNDGKNKRHHHLLLHLCIFACICSSSVALWTSVEIVDELGTKCKIVGHSARFTVAIMES